MYSSHSSPLQLYQYTFPLPVVFDIYPLVLQECSFECSIAFEIYSDSILTTDVLNTHTQALHVMYNNVPLVLLGGTMLLLVVLLLMVLGLFCWKFLCSIPSKDLLATCI